MNTGLKNSLIFITGGGIGFAVTFFVMKNVMKKKVQSETQAVRNAYDKYFGAEKETKEPPRDEHEIKEEIKEEAPHTDGEKILYNSYAKKYSEKSETVDEGVDEYVHEDYTEPEPYLISAEEYGDDGRPMIDLFYYSDDCLTDDDYNLIKDRLSIIGRDANMTLPITNKDSIFVRNPNIGERGTDYEIHIELKSLSSLVPPTR